jgi:hypothetical protein
MFRIFSVAACLVALAWPAAGAEVTAGSLKISAAWARATPKGASVGAGYLTITNTGPTADHLIGGSSEVASRVEIHSMTMENGVMRMRPVAGGLEIKPGETVALAPDGNHVMFVGLKAPLVQGRAVKVTLQFEKAGKVDVDFPVEGIGAMHGSDVHGMPMKH